MSGILSIHIIMKDESDWLSYCLESVKDADEIIAVDTGSSDASVSIAKSYGAKVFYSPWEEDFSKPRNEALRHTTTDWVCYLDADEQLTAGVSELRRLIDQAGKEVQAYTLLIENVLGAGVEDRLLHRSIRLFRADPGFRFEGRIHEQIGPSILQRHGAAAIRDSTVTVKHYGYLQGVLQAKGKVGRNEALLVKALEEQPENPFYLYNLGITYCQSGKLQEAKELMARALGLTVPAVSYRATLVKDLSRIVLELGELKQAELLLAQELEHYPDYADLHFIMGEALERQGQWERAYEAYRKAADSPGDKYVTELGTNSCKPFYRMGVLAKKLGQREEAARFFHEALKRHALFRPALQGIVEVFNELDVPAEQIAAFVFEQTAPQSPEAYAAAADALEAIGAFEQILACLPETLLTEPVLLHAYSTALIQTGKVQEAERRLIGYVEANDAEGGPDGVLQLAAICQWLLYGSLQNSLLSRLREPALHIYTTVNAKLVSRAASSETGVSSEPPDPYPGISDAVHSLIRRAVGLGRLQLAYSIAQGDPSSELVLAKSMYVEGYTMRAADRLIDLVAKQQLDDEGLHYLAELLFDKEHYLQAAELFENVVHENRPYEPSTTGAALCYLHLAEQCLSEVLGDGAEAAPFKEDIERIRGSIRWLNRTGWHTEWSGKRRGNVNVEAHDIAVHDRKE